MLTVEMNLDVFLSLAREQSQVKVDLFRGLMWPLTPTSRVVWEQEYPFSLISSTKEAYLTFFLALAP